MTANERDTQLEAPAPPTPGPTNQPPQARMIPVVMVTALCIVAVVPVLSLVALPFYGVDPPDELVAMGSLAIGALARDFKRIMTGAD